MTQPLPGQLGFDLDQALQDGAQAPQPAPPAGAWWLAFSADHDPDDARCIFRARTGQEPEHVRPGLGGLLLAGPVATARGAVQNVAG